MEFNKISVEVADHNADRIKKLLVSLSDIRNSISVKKCDAEKDSNRSFYTFTIESDVLKDFAIKLRQSQLKVVTQDYINSALKSTIKTNAAYNSAVDTGISANDLKSLRKVKTIEDFIEEGHYEVLLSIVRDIRAEQSKRHRAEVALPAAVKKAIEINFEDGKKTSKRAMIALTELIKIATNSQLKNLRLNYILENAGNKAIELCTLFKDFADELVKIGNNIKVPNIVSINAIIKFSQITLRSNRDFKYDYEADINFAIKNTNLRWLRMAFDTTEHLLDDENKEYFNRFLSFIEYKKLGN